MKTYSFCFAGDSTMQYNDYTTYPQTGWPQAFELFFPIGTVFKNFAKNGRSTKSFIDEGRLDEIDKELKQGDVLFVEFGHNDEKADETRHTDAFGSYQTNLEKFAEVARKHNADIIYLTPISRHHFTDGKIDATHGEYPQAMKEFCYKKGYKCIDMTELTRVALETLYNTEGQEATSALFMKDNTHLRHTGAFFISKIVYTQLSLSGFFQNSVN